MDIEGAEREVFAGAPDWVSSVGLLMIEFHDHFKSGWSDTVYAAMANRSAWTIGEVTFFGCPNRLQILMSLRARAQGPSECCAHARFVSQRSARWALVSVTKHRARIMLPWKCVVVGVSSILVSIIAGVAARFNSLSLALARLGFRSISGRPLQEAAGLVGPPVLDLLDA